MIGQVVMEHGFGQVFFQSLLVVPDGDGDFDGDLAQERHREQHGERHEDDGVLFGDTVESEKCNEQYDASDQNKQHRRQV